ncbi:MAG TPA: acyltransferase [Bacteroidia bacterium]|jgi:peptidoglycan/LPS O-acetylase OafA/YrhL|nr:acyltransferase [Bacteroidia bacterium]
MSLRSISHEVNNPQRIYGLDVLRALAACLVVYEHGNFLLEKFSPTLASVKIIDGVDLFFVLSGFLIGGILLREINRVEKIGLSFVKKFLIRRWFRTLPNYFLFLLINIILIYCGLANGFINKYLITFFIFMQNFFKPYDFLYWESWSLSVEEWFYFLFPLLLLMGAFFLRKDKKKLFLLCCLLMIGFSTLVRFYKAAHTDYTYDNWDLWIRKLVICRLDSIGFGLLAAWVHFYYNSAWVKSKWVCFTGGIVMCVFSATNVFENNRYFTETSYFTLSATSCMLLLPLAEQVKKFRTPVGKSVTLISIISYAMYLSHFGLAGNFIKHNLDYGARPALMYLLYWGFTLVFSALVFAFYEKPFTNLRERFT